VKSLFPYMVAMLTVAGMVTAPAQAQKRYDPGVTDTEIRIGQTLPYSGPASAYGTIGRAQAAYFAKVNAQGGIGGRKIRLISLDDAYNPARTVEQTRKLVEQERVFLIFNPIGTPTNIATREYLNARKVPQLFIGAGDTKWGDPAKYPWTMGFQQTYQFEGETYGIYLRRHFPGSKIAALYLNDDLGKELLAGLRVGLGSMANSMLVGTATYDLQDPTVDSQVNSLHASGADVFMNFALPKAAAQAIRKIYDLGWKPKHFLNYASNSVSETLGAAGLERSMGVLSADNLKDPTDTQWFEDHGRKEWLAWMRQYYPQGNVDDNTNVYAYNVARLLEHVLRACGDNLTRENVMKQAAGIRNLQLPMQIPGVTVNTSPSDFFPLEQLRLMRFDGKRWIPFGEIIQR
jgi:branched-chain amino acid transport system substrate-binding protein